MTLHLPLSAIGEALIAEALIGGALIGGAVIGRAVITSAPPPADASGVDRHHSAPLPAPPRGRLPRDSPAYGESVR
ncbi:hypothetical protein [Streptomyces fagopyri]|uniref:hypothetical protein n=1 Tax=Streptomyces fagopyri TaxID=2662397 RepID=UPI003712D793